MKSKKLKKDLNSKLKIAVVADPAIKYEDWYSQVKYIFEIFPNHELFTAYYDPQIIKEYFPKTKIHDTFLQLIAPESNEKKIWFKVEKLAYQTLSFKGFDAVISISSRSARFVRTGKGIKHIGILINPKQYDMCEKWKNKDRKAILKLDKVIVNSDSDKKRVQKIYGIDSKLVYPPVDIEVFNPQKLLNRKENWFLTDANIDIKALKLVIKSVVKAGVSLKIVGSLKKEEAETLVRELKARGLVKFLGEVFLENRIQLIQKCKAYVYPVKDGQFPKRVIEANASGTAVIGYKQESIQEVLSVEHPKTGILFEKYNSKSLSETLKNFSKEEFSSKNCIIKAQEFDPSIFMYKLRTYVEDTVQSD